ncbi:hypothetical protein AV274_0885 [Blastocystis sp. ATCC 50177/Nand II]|uniref:DJ-1/PfpI domain-containing protein n=1 Tax=Blastocystis sp. subtype 1 (strain ATCC 50177 / NandII) TaxID=478820 RepID=A0A196SJZ0_BLAHN|nr:hypothetical protein AV274_0885 [Blastocystis sp. ATCC 50177/Nand II]
MPRALVAISEGSEELEAIGVIDVLRRAKVNVTVASVDKTKTVKCARGSVLTADALMKDVSTKEYDAVVLPGGMPGAEHLRDCSALIDLLKRQKESGKIYAAICASPAVVFAHHHLIDGIPATCYPSFREEIEEWKNHKVVVSDNCSTSQGPGTAIDFALQLVASLCGEEVRDKVAKGLLY